MRVVLLIAACFAVSIGAAQTQPGATIRVHVVNSVTRNPIAGVNVTLNGESQLWGRTDTGGVFAGHPDSAGSYMLTATTHGYRMTGGGLGKMVELRADGETSVTVEMQPLGVIAGRVVDQFGDPVRHAVVRTEDSITAPGQDSYYESFSTAITDDRGEYRVVKVEPGRHYVVAEFSSAAADRDAGIRSSYRWPQTGGLTLYPDAGNIEQAEQVDVAPGATLQLQDLHLRIRRAVTISGRIKPASAGANHFLSLRRTNGLALSSSATVQGGGTEADGSFQVVALPGQYALSASDQKSGKISKPLMLELGDKDITGLELELTSGYEIRGRVVVDGQASIDYSKLWLNFGGSQVKIDVNGAFQTNLMESKGRYTLQQLPDDWFVETVVVAGQGLEGKQFAVQPGVTDMVLTLNPRGASVSVRPQGPGSEAVAMVALLRDSGVSPDPESILGAQTDGSGNFAVRSVPPGSYRVFTLDASSYLLMMRPDLLLEKYRAQAPLINVAEGERKELTLPVTKIEP